MKTYKFFCAIALGAAVIACTPKEVEPAVEGENGEVEFATVKEIRPISDEIREWMKLPEGVQI